MRRVLFVLLAAVVGAHAQTPPAPQGPTFRGGTDLVRVDVTVTVNREEAVTDLQAADFEVTEDGVVQTVETIKFVRLDGTRTSNLDEGLEIRSKEHALAEASRDDVRLFGIFLDDYHITKRPDITIPLRDALTRFVKQLGPNDLVVLMEPLTTLYDLKYTRAKDVLLDRIRTFEGRRGLTLPVKSALEEAQLTQRNWPELRAGVTLSALGALATHMGGLREGRKSILFFSEGPPLPPGGANEGRYREMVEAANRGNVTIHVIDPRPLGTSRFVSDTLRRIASDTGGRTILGTNDPGERIGEIMADASSYYLIGYTPTRREQDGKFHEIKVRVKRSGVRVTARRGYWAPTEKEVAASAAAAAAPVNVALQNALASLSDSVNVRAVTVWTGLAPGDVNHTGVAFTWEQNPGTARDKPARLEIQPVDDAGAEVMPAQVIGGTPGELPLVATFQLAPGRQRLRFTALTSTGDIIDRWVQVQPVPDFSDSPIVLSTPRFLRARTIAEFRAMETNPDAAPTAATRFAATDRVLVELRLQARDGSTPRLEVELLNAKGDLLRSLETPPVVDGKVRVPLPVSSLANSTYVLRIEAVAGEHATERWVAFQVAR